MVAGTSLTGLGHPVAPGQLISQCAGQRAGLNSSSSVCWSSCLETGDLVHGIGTSCCFSGRH